MRISGRIGQSPRLQKKIKTHNSKTRFSPQVRTYAYLISPSFVTGTAVKGLSDHPADHVMFRLFPGSTSPLGAASNILYKFSSRRRQLRIPGILPRFDGRHLPPFRLPPQHHSARRNLSDHNPKLSKTQELVTSRHRSGHPRVTRPRIWRTHRSHVTTTLALAFSCQLELRPAPGSWAGQARGIRRA